MNKPDFDAGFRSGWDSAVQEVAKYVAEYMQLSDPSKSPWEEWLPRFLSELTQD